MGKRRWKTIVLLGAMVALLTLADSTVSAHAHLQSADPADKAALTKAPTQVLLTFTQPTSMTKSGGSVTDAGGTLVSTGFKVDPSDGMKMTIDLKPNLPNGTYTVKWNTFTEADNGPDEGTFSFTVQAPVNAGGPVSANAGTTAASNPGTGDDALSRWLLGVMIGCATVTIFAAGIALGTRPQHS